MGRVKLPISRILNNTNRQVTYSKRRNGLLKKAYEIAVLCDIDIALLMISPSGRISCFSGTKRIEDVLLRYFNLTDEERESDHEMESVVCDKESVINTLIRLKTEEAATQRTENLSKQAEEYRQEFLKVQHQLEIAKRQLRALEPEKHKFSSLDEVESCEECLLKTLNLVEERKRHLVTERSSSYQDTVEQINSVVQYIVNAQAEATAALENTALSSWVEQENKGGINGSKNVSTGSDAYPSLNRNQMSPAAIDSSGNADNMNNEGLQINNTREECLQQWNQSPAYFLSSYNTKHHFL